jgi:hypothetical protein
MNNNPIFYVINGQFYENSDSNSRKLKKIALIFENEEAKTLRSNALKKFSEIRDTFLVKNNAAAPTYHLFNSIGKLTCVDAIENVPFFTNQSKLNLALTLSFGIKVNSKNYNLIDSDKYPYNKNLHPICAIGKDLHQIENSLKINLILEKNFYEHYNEVFDNVNIIKKFITIDFLKDYIINSYNRNQRGFQKIEILKSVMNNTIFDIFPTSQFYSYDKVDRLIPTNSHFLELFAEHSNTKLSNKSNIYKKELENITEFYKLLCNDAKSFSLSDTPSVSRNLRRQSLEPFFTQKQISIYEKMKKLEDKFNKASNKNESMKSLIEKYL